MLARDLRTPRERTLFTIAAIFSSIVWLALLISIVGIVYGALLGLFALVVHCLFMAHVIGNGVRVGPRQLPDLMRRIEAAAHKLGMDRVPEAYVLQAGGLLNAFATKILEPPLHHHLLRPARGRRHRRRDRQAQRARLRDRPRARSPGGGTPGDAPVPAAGADHALARPGLFARLRVHLRSLRARGHRRSRGVVARAGDPGRRPARRAPAGSRRVRRSAPRERALLDGGLRAQLQPPLPDQARGGDARLAGPGHVRARARATRSRTCWRRCSASPRADRNRRS